MENEIPITISYDAIFNNSLVLFACLPVVNHQWPFPPTSRLVFSTGSRVVLTGFTQYLLFHNSQEKIEFVDQFLYKLKLIKSAFCSRFRDSRLLVQYFHYINGRIHAHRHWERSQWTSLPQKFNCSNCFG